MGYINMYLSLIPDVYATQAKPVKQPEEVSIGLPIIPDAKEVTLAEYDVRTKNAITAHHLKDYRRKQFNLVLLPKIDTMFDRLLKGSTYWGKLLSDDSDTI